MRSLLVLFLLSGCGAVDSCPKPSQYLRLALNNLSQDTEFCYSLFVDLDTENPQNTFTDGCTAKLTQNQCGPISLEATCLASNFSCDFNPPMTDSSINGHCFLDQGDPLINCTYEALLSPRY
jgi:hypothetical protein